MHTQFLSAQSVIRRLIHLSPFCLKRSPIGFATLFHLTIFSLLKPFHQFPQSRLGNLFPTLHQSSERLLQNTTQFLGRSRGRSAAHPHTNTLPHQLPQLRHCAHKLLYLIERSEATKPLKFADGHSELWFVVGISIEIGSSSVQDLRMRLGRMCLNRERFVY